MSLSVGQLIAGRYHLQRKLGDGAMGAVYEAENVSIHRRVAIKVLHPHVAERHDALRRFEREAQAAGRIGSEHIVEVLDLGEMESGGRFMVMELLEGMTLQQRIREQGRLHPAEAAAIVCQLLSGLGAAHHADIVHRDLKPANVFLAHGKGPGAGDFVKILDFGVSKFSVMSDDMAMTGAGSVVGTPYYMSPEQAKGARHIDARSDLYAVGVILYEAVTGHVPFEAQTLNELIFRIVLEAPPPVESVVPDLDPAFCAIVKKAMMREPDERYQSALDMHDALRSWLTDGDPLLTTTATNLLVGRPPPARRAQRRSTERALALGVIATLALGAIMLFASRPRTSVASNTLVTMGSQATPNPGPAEPALIASTTTLAPPSATATGEPAHAPDPAPLTPSTNARLNKPVVRHKKAGPAAPIVPAKRQVPTDL